MSELEKSNFHKELQELMDKFASEVYDCTSKFPKDEIFGLTSQLRRASISVVLNYIEGYARRRDKVFRNFLDISYGSLKEAKYLVYFCHKRKFIGSEEYKRLVDMSERIGKMLWGIISKVESNN